jgi:hypothetical protein
MSSTVAMIWAQINEQDGGDDLGDAAERGIPDEGAVEGRQARVAPVGHDREIGRREGQPEQEAHQGDRQGIQVRRQVFLPGGAHGLHDDREQRDGDPDPGSHHPPPTRTGVTPLPHRGS